MKHDFTPDNEYTLEYDQMNGELIIRHKLNSWK